MIYSYVLRSDKGSAPNPFWGLCTLAICKPQIRRNAHIGDWVIGTGSAETKLCDGKIQDLSNYIVYAMKITDIKTFNEYDSFCQKELQNKIPRKDSEDWRIKVGDCIYDYSKGPIPTIREGVHSEKNREKDLNGINVLLSNYFYYFGENAKSLYPDLISLIKKGPGHKKVTDQEIIIRFEEWISQFEKNKLYGNPQYNQHEKICPSGC